ncbi:MAG TPA: hypothetical protein V6D00_09420 [Pantanalinema sp.]
MSIKNEVAKLGHSMLPHTLAKDVAREVAAKETAQVASKALAPKMFGDNLALGARKSAAVHSAEAALHKLDQHPGDGPLTRDIVEFYQRYVHPGESAEQIQARAKAATLDLSFLPDQGIRARAESQIHGTGGTPQSVGAILSSHQFKVDMTTVKDLASEGATIALSANWMTRANVATRLEGIFGTVNGLIKKHELLAGPVPQINEMHKAMANMDFVFHPPNPGAKVRFVKSHELEMWNRTFGSIRDSATQLLP